ncbi:MAG TPA: hypothetical protein VML01_04505 [Bryobacterales bacterium]|nr:hypothetical protein [Bryobacterales bacterium]
MATPVHQRNVININGIEFHAHSCEMRVGTAKDELGLPQMGTQATKICVSVDVQDEENMPFDKIQSLFELSNIVTSDKIVGMTFSFLRDENPDNVIVSFKLEGWISLFSVSNYMTPGGGADAGAADGPGLINNRLYLEIEPRVNEMNYKEITIGN